MGYISICIHLYIHTINPYFVNGKSRKGVDSMDSSECQTHHRMYCRSVEQIEEIKAFQVLMVHFSSVQLHVSLFSWSSGDVPAASIFPVGVSGAICAATWW